MAKTIKIDARRRLMKRPKAPERLSPAASDGGQGVSPDSFIILIDENDAPSTESATDIQGAADRRTTKR